MNCDWDIRNQNLRYTASILCVADAACMQRKLWKNRHKCGLFADTLTIGSSDRREPLVPADVRWHPGWGYRLDLRLWNWQHSYSAFGLVDRHKARGGRGVDNAFHWNGAAL